MGEVINLADVLHRRRVADAEQRHAAAVEARKTERRAAVHSSFADAGPAGEVLADLVADAIEHREEREQSSRYRPAYCDPSNETRGTKYEGTRALGTKEIAARIRADIKAARDSGHLPKELKVSVRYKSFSGGSAIDISVTGTPPGFTFWNPAYLRWEEENKHVSGLPPYSPDDRLSPGWRDILAKLKAIQNAYNRDNSDSMSDYFDVRFYGDVGIDWRISSDRRKAETAAAMEGGQ